MNEPISVLLAVTNAESNCWKWPLKTTEEEADRELLTMVSAKKKKGVLAHGVAVLCISQIKKKKPLVVANWLNWQYDM